MIRTYLTVAFRAIVRNKLSAFINIFGLALAMTCALLITLFIRDELEYDKYNAHADRMYRVTRNFLSKDGSVNLHLGHVAPPFGPLLKNDFGDFEEVARTLNNRVTMSYQDNAEVKKSFNEDNFFFAEPELFKIFTISVAEGDPAKVLSEPMSLMMSEKSAKKYFGNENPLGKTLRVNGTFDMVVGGIFKEFPKQSHFHPEIFASFSTLNDTTIYGRRRLETNWGNNSFATYILASKPLDIKAIEKQFPAFLDRHMKSDDPSEPKTSTWTTLFLQKVTDIHLTSHLDSELEANGNINNVYMMAVIAVFIILIACFNFVNLSTARASKRAKEVGLRKAVGAFKAQLIGQYLSESILIAGLAFVFAMAFSFLSIGWLNEFTGKSMVLNPVNDFILFGGLVGFTITVGILAGIYPAFVLSGFKPALVLKGQQTSGGGKGFLRKALVVAQFAVSIVLIIATAITLSQLSYLNNRELGYQKDQIITLRYYPEVAANYEAFFNELTKDASIANAARSSRIPTGRLLDSQGSARVQKGNSLSESGVVLKNIRIDHDFFSTYQIDFASGRDFSKERVNDDSASFILNESAVSMLGLTNENIIDKEFHYGDVKGKVIGVVKDFHFESLHEPIVPLVFQNGPFFSRLSVKLTGNNPQNGIESIARVWQEFMPNRPFEYEFLSMQYKNLYEAEQKQSQLFIIFAGLAILIACLGLFGLATFNAAQRVKEIGVRKVLGASVGSILGLLSREIVVLIVIANVIAWPIAWYFMNEWLSSFAYHITMNVVVYIVSALAAIAVALITVSTQTIRAAKTNPATTLRYE
ncbi:ABC transporter permease [Chryseolinea sp. T2]|uniref:ABC transporter permease n=1 Tax=Chryseolinea sp. T2 TaxID=3129255 RepID=UPI0030780047